MKEQLKLENKVNLVSKNVNVVSKRVENAGIMLLLLLSMLTVSCEGLLDVDTPAESILKSQVFSDDQSGEAAIRGAYLKMKTSVYNGFEVARVTGLSADEFTYQGTDLFTLQFLENELLDDNEYVEDLWVDAYASIYAANDIINGVEASAGMTLAVKDQIKGEALFLRAFYHFYLVNLFGAVPIVTSTDYRVNAIITRNPVSAVYSQIESDLNDALGLLSPAYPSTGRVRANQSVANALLARVYLYQQKWQAAETLATKILDNTMDYGLVPLSDISLADNKEAIWQMHPSAAVGNGRTPEGVGFSYGSYILRDELTGGNGLPGVFESGDARKTDWIHLDLNNAFNVPYKYQVWETSGAIRNEYSTIFRLAEQYLIRAEARAEQNKLGKAMEDLDVIRSRAGLSLISETNPDISQSDLLELILHERQVELFSEWGHRWLDLKRTGKAYTTLSVLKPGFSVEDEQYPIPKDELNSNPNLGDQNEGY